MAIQLQGSCFVTSLAEGTAWSERGITVRTLVSRASGTEAISLRTIELAPGLSPGIEAPRCGDVLFVLSGRATLHLDGRAREVEPDTGVYVAAGVTLTVDNPGPEPLVLVSSRCPDPGEHPRLVEPVTGASSSEPMSVIRLQDRDVEPAGDRWYSVLVGDDVGSTEVTQFIGSIPPGRAPDHFHPYEEVIVVLNGTGRMWAGRESTTIGTGSCIYLPRKQIHCLENTGAGELRLLGVFYPAGSPAVRYDAD